MAEELIQRGLLASPEQMGEWSFYNIGATTLRQLKAARIIPDKDYAEYELKKPDAIIVQKPSVIAAIEYKDPTEFRTRTQVDRAVQQEIGTARALGAKVYIVTDGTKSVWVNPATGNPILLPDGNPLATKFDKASAECIDALRKAVVSVGIDSDVISERVVVDPLPLARKVWQDLWAVSGATPEKCLYTFVEVFIFKFLSDLEILSPGRTFADLLEQFERGSEEDALRFYAQLIRPEIKRHFKESPVDHTTVINGMIFVTKDGDPVGGYAATFKSICKRFEQFGKLDAIDRDFKSRLFETFLKESISKKNWGQFFTPLKVVRAIVNMADISEGMSICDPACGVGKFLLEPLVSEDGRFVAIEDGKLVSKLKMTGLDKGFDKEEQRTIILAKANMLIYLSSIIRNHPELSSDVSSLLNDTFFLQTDSILGTLARPVTEEYDLILTNPPYVMSGSGNLKGEIAKNEELREFYSVNAMGVEGLFMEWVVKALKRGGKAFIVVPDGIMNRAHDLRLRKFILDECDIDAVISLPLNTFFTTNKKTYILAITRKRQITVDGTKTLPAQTSPVFTYLCSEVGETRDINRFPIEQNDLESAADWFNMFKGSRLAFRPTDPRCKIQPIEKFKSEATWTIDDWWTIDEKIALGIEDETETMAVEDYISLIGDVSSSLMGIGSELDEVIGATSRGASDVRELPISSLVTLKKGHAKYTRKYGNEHQGEYPVYSAAHEAPLTFIDTYDYDGRYLTWATNGFAGKMLTLEGRFSLNGDRAILLPLEDGPAIDIDYLRYVLEPRFRKLAKGRKGDRGANEFTKLYVSMVESVSVPIPVDENGHPDIVAQKAIAQRYRAIEECQTEMLSATRVLLDKDLFVEVSAMDGGPAKAVGVICYTPKTRKHFKF